MIWQLLVKRSNISRYLMKKGIKDLLLKYLNTNSSAAKAESFSHLIIATKAQDALAALNPILSQLSHSAKVLCLSNGLGIHQALLAALKYQSKAKVNMAIIRIADNYCKVLAQMAHD